MGSTDPEKTSSPSPGQSSSTSAKATKGEGAEETRIRQSLLERPSFTIKNRLALIFFSIFMISAAIAAAGIFMFTMIKYRIQYISLADRLHIPQPEPFALLT